MRILGMPADSSRRTETDTQTVGAERAVDCGHRMLNVRPFFPSLLLHGL